MLQSTFVICADRHVLKERQNYTFFYVLQRVLKLKHNNRSILFLKDFNLLMVFRPSRQMFLASIGMVGELPDGTQSQKEFSFSKNNRYIFMIYCPQSTLPINL